MHGEMAYTAVQIQKAVSTYFTSKQILHFFVIVKQCTMILTRDIKSADK